MNLLKKKQIEIKLLHEDFYADNKLKELLEHKGGRGYGIFLFEIKGFRWGIPLRSKMRKEHNFSFKTRREGNTDPEKYHGLDYSKAVIIRDEKYVGRKFNLREKEDYIKIIKNVGTIEAEFIQFLNQYIDAHKNEDHVFLNIQEIKYSTLQNYFSELGIESNKTV